MIDYVIRMYLWISSKIFVMANLFVVYFPSRISTIFPMNSPLEAYDVLVRPIVVGFPFFGNRKKERKSSKSSSDQAIVSTACKNSNGKGILYYLERASLIQGAATGSVAQRVSLMMDKIAKVSGGVSNMPC